jgi:hypothetical protein
VSELTFTVGLLELNPRASSIRLWQNWFDGFPARWAAL